MTTPETEDWTLVNQVNADTSPRTCSIGECSRPYRARGMCSTHWRRWDRLRKRGGNEYEAHALVEAGRGGHSDPAGPRLTRTSIARGQWLTKREFAEDIRQSGGSSAFWSHVVEQGTCWIWTGRTQAGYGKHRGLGSHRYAYMHLRGEIPDGLELDHLCNTPPCVNPWHLEPVTRQENSRRRWERYWAQRGQSC